MPCQYYYVNESKTWQEAQSYCRGNYIDLATVDSMLEVDDCVNEVDPGYGGDVWIGLKRTWAWSTGDSLNSNYTPWTTYQPNEGNAEAACALFGSTGWQDYFCSNTFYTFCFDGNLFILAVDLCQNIFYTSD